jgi:predicted nuclease with TOPRIM domain
MGALFTNYGAKSALQQLNAKPSAKPKLGEVLPDRMPGASVRGGSVYFSVSGAFKSDRAIISGLNDSLNKARASVAGARSGASRLSGVLDKVDQVIGAVEAGTSGKAFASTLEGYETEAALAVKGAQVGDTNLLKAGDTLNITFGISSKDGGFDFRQVNVEAIGLAPTEGARATTSLTRVVAETVDVAVTRADRLTERMEKLAARTEKLTERIARTEARTERLTSRMEKMAEKKDVLSSRMETFESKRTEITEQLAKKDGTPADERSERYLEIADRFQNTASRLFGSGNNFAGMFFQALSNAARSQVVMKDVLSAEQVENLQADLAKTDKRIERLKSRVERIDTRTAAMTERLVRIEEKKVQLGERIERTNARAERIEARMARMSEEQLNRVVGTRTETVERTVTVEEESETGKAFGNLLGLVSEKLKAGDTEGAKQLVTEASARLERVGAQLDQISGSVDNRSSYFGDVTERLSATIKDKVNKVLDEETAARIAAGALSELDRIEKLFSTTDPQSNLLELFEGRGDKPEEAESEPEAADTKTGQDED